MNKILLTKRIWKFVLAIVVGAQFVPPSASAADSAVVSDIFYPQIKEMNYDYQLEKNRFIFTVNIKIRYHRNPSSYLQLLYTTPKIASGCQIRNFAPTTFDFGLSDLEVETNVFSSPSGLNASKLTNRIQDGDWFIDEYTATVSENGLDQKYYDFVSKCGPRELSGVLVYDISGKAVVVDVFEGKLYQSNMNRMLPPTLASATFDTEQASCPPIEVKDGPRTLVNRLACTHNINFDNYTLSYLGPANPNFSISAKLKAAADKAAADKAAADKAAADKAAADKARTLKKTTITCTKGKLTKKVTSVNPKCPAGYKKK